MAAVIAPDGGNNPKCLIFSLFKYVLFHAFFLSARALASIRDMHECLISSLLMMMTPVPVRPSNSSYPRQENGRLLLLSLTIVERENEERRT